jgi:hypothetical protein
MNKRNTNLIIIGLLVSGLALVAWSLFRPAPQVSTHYHANFAIFIDGERLDFSSDGYMEDLANCADDYKIQFAEDRAHLHENDSDVIHIHDDGVTWGHYLANLGFGFGDDYLVNDDKKLYQAQAGKSIKFVLNGKKSANLFNQLVGNEDRLLISFGSEDLETVLKEQYTQVANSAHEHNEKDDPGSCSSNRR